MYIHLVCGLSSKMWRDLLSDPKSLTLINGSFKPAPAIELPSRGCRNNARPPSPDSTSRMRLNLPSVCRRPQTLRLASPRARARRTYAFQASGGPAFKVFNRRTKWLQKERAAANPELSRQADYLKDEVAMRVCERLLVWALFFFFFSFLFFSSSAGETRTT